MSFNLNNEKATGILIWWIEGSDGSIEKEEEDAIEDILHNLNYSMEEYRGETKMFISGLSNERMEEAVDAAIQWGNEHFDEQRKQTTINLLQTVANCSGVEENEQEKLEHVKQAFDLN